MAARKKPKSRSARGAGKQGPPAKAARRTAAKAARRKPPQKARGTNRPGKPRVLVVPPAEPLFRAAELDGAVAHKSARKSESRPARPPAKLPIPQSTYFF
jgi:hypothetical protein